jgi:enoyl-CoA hydratase/carnithine racemase
MTISARAFLEQTSSPAAAESLAVVVDLGGEVPAFDVTATALALRRMPTIFIGVAEKQPDGAGGQLASLLDVLVADPTAVLRTVEHHPLASMTLAQILRATLQLDIDAALAAESAGYSVLQAGPEFARWRSTRAVRPSRDEGGAVIKLMRDGPTLSITLCRPEKHNAFNTAMRDQLYDALILAAADESIERVVIEGAGRSFSSGGDLDEFGSFPDPATAHLTRLARSAGRLLAAIAPKVEARLHGACMGAGIELPAFAARVVADPDTVISLPEVGLGLIPGAGGTVSLPRRIGRQRTCELALTQHRIDASTALEWGLVDEISPQDPPD